MQAIAKFARLKNKRQVSKACLSQTITETFLPLRYLRHILRTSPDDPRCRVLFEPHSPLPLFPRPPSVHQIPLIENNASE